MQQDDLCTEPAGLGDSQVEAGCHSEGPICHRIEQRKSIRSDLQRRRHLRRETPILRNPQCPAQGRQLPLQCQQARLGLAQTLASLSLGRQLRCLPARSPIASRPTDNISLLGEIRRLSSPMGFSEQGTRLPGFEPGTSQTIPF